MEVDASLLHIEFIEDAIIADAQLEFRAALEPFVREISQSRSHFIHFALHCVADGRRQGIEGFRKGGRPNLKRSRHGYFGWRVVNCPAAISRWD